MTSFEFALSIETCLRKEIRNKIDNTPQEVTALYKIIDKTQNEFETILERAMHTRIDSEPFPIVEPSILGNDIVWKKTTEAYSITANTSIQLLMDFWEIHILIEKSAQFYQQAALNTPHPAEKIFFTSCSEVKHILRRRIYGILQIMCNHAWAELGFTPFVFAKY